MSDPLAYKYLIYIFKVSHIVAVGKLGVSVFKQRRADTKAACAFWFQNN